MSPEADAVLARVRLVSGIVLMAFATTHLINHAFGLISLDAMEQVRRTPLGIWHKGPLNLILLAALLAHIAASLIMIARKRNVRMATWQWFQILSGVLIPIWLTGHVLGTGVIQGVHRFEVNYYFVMPLLWPGLAERQILMSLLIWLHGCIGVHYWLRPKPLYRRFQSLGLVLAILIPSLSMAGFVAAGKDLQLRVVLEEDLKRAWSAEYAWPKFTEIAWTLTAEAWLVAGFSALLMITAGWWLLREVVTARRNKILIQYDDGQQVRVAPGTSVLEASQIAGIPHASVCGGRGRCSTCRIRVHYTEPSDIPQPEPDEARVLKRLGALTDVRLACRLRPKAPLKVVRLMAPATLPNDALKPMTPALGSERELAILFADLRGFTQLSESRLPFDVVHLLNRYFEIMGQAIEQQGGRIDKFIGDGIMALFGVDSDPKQAAANAIAAAGAMGLGLHKLNEELADDLNAPLRMGIGLHMGPAIVGEMGYGRTVGITAVGDTVNTASRLESACKELGVELAVSKRLVDRSGLHLTEDSRYQLELRGKSSKVDVMIWQQARTVLSALPNATTTSAQSGWRKIIPAMHNRLRAVGR